MLQLYDKKGEKQDGLQADWSVLSEGKEKREPQMQKEVREQEMSGGGGNTEGLVNTALDMHSPRVSVCPSSSFPFYI